MNEWRTAVEKSKSVVEIERKPSENTASVNSGEITSTSQFLVFLRTKAKPHWDRWAWAVVGLAAILAVIGGVIKLWR
jgi:hypothetical protein